MTEETNAAKPSGGRAWLVVVELVLLVGTLWILIWQPLGQNVSPVVAIMLALVFIGLFPAMLKGGRVAQIERDHLGRRFSERDDNRRR